MDSGSAAGRPSRRSSGLVPDSDPLPPAETDQSNLLGGFSDPAPALETAVGTPRGCWSHARVTRKSGRIDELAGGPGVRSRGGVQSGSASRVGFDVRNPRREFGERRERWCDPQRHQVEYGIPMSHRKVIAPPLGQRSRMQFRAEPLRRALLGEPVRIGTSECRLASSGGNGLVPEPRSSPL
jgi:hypothetical protein